ncbi:hypothetical protein WJX84_001127 [Apatococcus fuscideae]|uniref:Uncharacterized protein n=1 Tax=Apatococcus fuscideae TaxID=2026836 RepID=A0AAW1T5X2_9CHLO
MGFTAVWSAKGSASSVSSGSGLSRSSPESGAGALGPYTVSDIIEKASFVTGEAVSCAQRDEVYKVKDVEGFSVAAASPQRASSASIDLEARGAKALLDDPRAEPNR